MARVVIYWVRTATQLRQYGAREDATAHARAISLRGSPASVLEVRGDPAADCWDEPRLVESFGLAD